MGCRNTPRMCFTTLLLLITAVTPFVEPFDGSCYRINYKERNCGKLLRSAISKSSCCRGSYRRAWSPYRGQSERSVWLSSNQTILEEYDNVIRLNLGCYPCYDSCKDIKCDEDQKCVIKKGLPKCVCNPKCHLQHKSAVCGTDNRTYSSECHLLKRSCRKKQRLSVMHSGPCQSCSGVRCGSRKTCVLDELLTPQCLKCPRNCRANRKPICGTDNNTYLSRCFMKKASCNTGITIERAYKGPCLKGATCANVSCRSDETCLTNTKTKQPRCSWCTDLQRCEADQRVICASDGAFYQSWCAFKHASCRSKKALTAFPLQFCNKKVTKTEKSLDCREHKHRRKKSRKLLKVYRSKYLANVTLNQATLPGHVTRVTKGRQTENLKSNLKKSSKNRKKKRKKIDCFT